MPPKPNNKVNITEITELKGRFFNVNAVIYDDSIKVEEIELPNKCYGRCFFDVNGVAHDEAFEVTDGVEIKSPLNI